MPALLTGKRVAVVGRPSKDGRTIASLQNHSVTVQVHTSQGVIGWAATYSDRDDIYANIHIDNPEGLIGWFLENGHILLSLDDLQFTVELKNGMREYTTTPEGSILGPLPDHAEWMIFHDAEIAAIYAYIGEDPWKEPEPEHECDDACEEFGCPEDESLVDPNHWGSWCGTPGPIIGVADSTLPDDFEQICAVVRSWNEYQSHPNTATRNVWVEARDDLSNAKHKIKINTDYLPSIEIDGDTVIESIDGPLLVRVKR